MFQFLKAFAQELCNLFNRMDLICYLRHWSQAWSIEFKILHIGRRSFNSGTDNLKSGWSAFDNMDPLVDSFLDACNLTLWHCIVWRSTMFITLLLRINYSCITEDTKLTSIEFKELFVWRLLITMRCDGLWRTLFWCYTVPGVLIVLIFSFVTTDHLKSVIRKTKGACRKPI